MRISAYDDSWYVHFCEVCQEPGQKRHAKTGEVKTLVCKCGTPVIDPKLKLEDRPPEAGTGT